AEHKDRRRRSQFQRRPNVHDAIQAVDQLLVFGRAIAEVFAPFFEVTKELLDAHRGRESDQNAPRPRSVVDKRVRHAPRSKDGIAWPQPKPLIADFDDVLSGEAIEPLVLLFVVVPGWTGSTTVDRLLGHEERAAAVLGRDLDVKAVAARQRDDVVRPPGSGG